MVGCEGPIPSVFKEGWLRQLIKRSRSSAAQTGWLVISNKNKERYADIMRRLRDPLLAFN